MVAITVFASPDDIAHSSPRGFSFVDGVFKEARLKDSISVSQSGAAGLQRDLGYLLRRYPGRLRVEWINPWSLSGLVYSLRYRLRGFPVVLLRTKTKQIILVGEQIGSLKDQVTTLLAQPADDQEP